jgi:Ser/Thr protein kinase RdoA (MazF antagonist)
MFLHHNMKMNVPQPKLVTYSGVLEGVENSVYCTLLTWVAGQPLQPETITLEQVKTTGTYIAKLHDSAAGFAPTSAFKRPRLDGDGLFSEKSHYHPGDLEQFFTAEQQAVMANVIAKIRAVMETIGTSSETFGMIHADLISKNILFDKNEVGVIDFEECGYGYYLYDLTPMLWENRKSPRYAQIKAALWAGYTAISPQHLPYEQYLEAFVAARHVASCLWIAGNADHPAIRGHVPEILSERVEEMRQFLQTGSIA